MNLKYILPFLLIVANLTNSFAQKTKINDEEFFKDQNTFKECQLDITVEYSTKKMEPFVEAVKKLKDEELVLVSIKKKDKPTYMFCYFVFMDVNGNPYPVLTKSKDFKQKKLPKGGAIIADDKKNKSFFFYADCFRDILEQHPKLEDNFQKIE